MKKRTYTAEDFVSSTTDPVEVAAAMKMGVLADMQILKGVSEANVNRLHDILLSCKSEWEMQTILHKLIRFEETVEELLIRKEK